MSDVSLTTTSSSDDSSEDEVRMERIPRRYRGIRDRRNPYEIFDEEEFKMRFRFSKATILWLHELIGHDLEPTTRRRKSISAINKILITMRYLATGSFQQLVGDTVAVHKSTVCVVIKSVIQKIAQLKPQFIKMPNREELHNVQLKFYRKRRMPRVIGAIDCSHIRIESPGGPNAEIFRNRKGFFSINVQAVCDADLQIRNIVARWPGSVHDSTIFNDSSLCAHLERGEYENGFLLGDSGYACRPFLLTPVLNPRTAAEEAYNLSHRTTRNAIERCFGVLKRRFPCLSLGLRTKMNTTLATIVACAVLHNIAIFTNDNEPPRDPDVEVPQELEIEPVHRNNNINENTAARTALIRTHFH